MKSESYFFAVLYYVAGKHQHQANGRRGNKLCGYSKIAYFFTFET